MDLIPLLPYPQENAVPEADLTAPGIAAIYRLGVKSDTSNRLQGHVHDFMSEIQTSWSCSQAEPR